eukprot:Nk52_evm9s559 gene=Nk52_evmTU9s559
MPSVSFDIVFTKTNLNQSKTKKEEEQEQNQQQDKENHQTNRLSTLLTVSSLLDPPARGLVDNNQLTATAQLKDTTTATKNGKKKRLPKRLLEYLKERDSNNNNNHNSPRGGGDVDQPMRRENLVEQRRAVILQTKVKKLERKHRAGVDLVKKQRASVKGRRFELQRKLNHKQEQAEVNRKRLIGEFLRKLQMIGNLKEQKREDHVEESKRKQKEKSKRFFQRLLCANARRNQITNEIKKARKMHHEKILSNKTNLGLDLFCRSFDLNSEIQRAQSTARKNRKLQIELRRVKISSSNSNAQRRFQSRREEISKQQLEKSIKANQLRLQVEENQQRQIRKQRHSAAEKLKHVQAVIHANMMQFFRTKVDREREMQKDAKRKEIRRGEFLQKRILKNSSATNANPPAAAALTC